jgi:hypothetical protein
VPFRAQDRIMDLWVDSSGNILAVSPPRTLLSTPVRVQFLDLPRPVQDALGSCSEGASIDGIERGFVQGQRVYEATVNRDGRKVDLRFAEDGALLRDTVNDRFLAETGRMPSFFMAANVVPARLPLQDEIPISFNQLPEPVRVTLQRCAGPDFVERIEKGTVGGQPLYQATFTHAGEKIPLRIAQDGALMGDDVNRWCLAKIGQAPYTTVARDWHSAPVRVSLTDVRQLAFDQLPLPVQDTLRYYAGGATIRSLVQGYLNDEILYQADFDWHGTGYELRIAGDGSVISDRDNARFMSQFNPRIPTSVGGAPLYESQQGSGSGPAEIRIR